jgi:hypothetical protein
MTPKGDCSVLNIFEEEREAYALLLSISSTVNAKKKKKITKFGYLVQGRGP